jgi:adenylate kinase
MVLLLFGPPSCGKGTQAPLVSDLLHIPAISTGEMLRGEVAAQSELGKTVQAIMSSGMLVSDDLISQALSNRLDRADCRQGFLLDGYPRTIAQAQFLDKLLKQKGYPAPLVLSLTCDPKILIGRACARRSCPACGKIYNILFKPPRVENRCDACNVELFHRADDKEEVVAQRLNQYERLTAPVISFYRGPNYFEFDAALKPDQVFTAIRATLDKVANTTGALVG